MMQFERWLSLRSFLAALLALTVCCGSAGVIMTNPSKDPAALRALDEEMQRVAGAVSERLSDSLAAIGRDASLAAENAVFDRELRLPAVQQFLGRWRSLHPEYADILFADRSGRVLAAASGSLLSADVSGTTWFARALSGVVIGDASERARPGAEIPRNVIVGTPVRGGGTAATGVLAIQLTPTWVEEAVAGARRILGGASRTASVQIMNAGGRSIYQSGVPVARGELREANAAVGDEAGLGWFVIAKGSRQTEVDATTLGSALPLILGLAALAALSGWLLGGRLTRSLVTIRNAAVADQVTWLPAATAIAEIADLADAVGACIGRSVGRERIQQEARAALARSRDRVRAVKLLGGFTCWEVDLRNGHVTWAGGSADMADSTSERADQLDRVLSRVDEDDQGPLRQAMRAACETPGSIREIAVRTVAGREDVTGQRLLLRLIAVVSNGQPVRLHVLSREVGLVALPAPKTANSVAIAQPGGSPTAPADARTHAVIAGLAHEIGAALITVVAAATTLDPEARDARHRNGIETVVRQATRGTALTRKLAAVVSRDGSPTPDIDAARAITETLQLIGTAILPQLSITQPQAERLPPLGCTGRQLEVTLLNLASDASESLPSDATASIAIDTTSGPPGIGLRIVLTTATAFRAGRGMTAIHELMIDIGGDVAVENLGDRCTVTLSFPAARAVSAGAAPGCDAADARMILLVEPDAVMRAATAESLSALGYVVEAVASSEEACAALGSRRDFTVLLCAHTMPAVNGAHLAEIVSRTHPTVEIVLMAAEAVPAHSSATFRWLRKPFGSQDLARLLDRNADRQRQAA